MVHDISAVNARIKCRTSLGIRALQLIQAVCPGLVTQYSRGLLLVFAWTILLLLSLAISPAPHFITAASVGVAWIRLLAAAQVSIAILK